MNTYHYISVETDGLVYQKYKLFPNTTFFQLIYFIRQHHVQFSDWLVYPVIRPGNYVPHASDEIVQHVSQLQHPFSIALTLKKL